MLSKKKKKNTTHKSSIKSWKTAYVYNYVQAGWISTLIQAHVRDITVVCFRLLVNIVEAVK